MSLASLFDPGILRTALLPSLQVHTALAVPTYILGRVTDHSKSISGYSEAMRLTMRADSGRMKVPAGRFETSDPSNCCTPRWGPGRHGSAPSGSTGDDKLTSLAALMLPYHSGLLA
jgi:hypothetical protein